MREASVARCNDEAANKAGLFLIFGLDLGLLLLEWLLLHRDVHGWCPGGRLFSRAGQHVVVPCELTPLTRDFGVFGLLGQLATTLCFGSIVGNAHHGGLGITATRVLTRSKSKGVQWGFKRNQYPADE